MFLLPGKGANTEPHASAVVKKEGRLDKKSCFCLGFAGLLLLLVNVLRAVFITLAVALAITTASGGDGTVAAAAAGPGFAWLGRICAALLRRLWKSLFFFAEPRDAAPPVLPLLTRSGSVSRDSRGDETWLLVDEEE